VTQCQPGDAEVTSCSTPVGAPKCLTTQTTTPSCKDGPAPPAVPVEPADPPPTSGTSSSGGGCDPKVCNGSEGGCDFGTCYVCTWACRNGSCQSSCNF
jgi:hypothetical protein